MEGDFERTIIGSAFAATWRTFMKERRDRACLKFATSKPVEDGALDEIAVGL